MSETITCEWCAEEIPAGAARCPKCQGSINRGGQRVQGTPLAPKSEPVQPAKPNPPAGWYNDPKLVNTRRYWDGQKWTDHRLEGSMPAARASTKEQVYSSPLGGGTTTDKNAVALYHWGILAGILFPLLGLIMGLILLSKKANWGLRLIVGSIATATIYYRLFFAGGT